jgi:DNA-binding transcriptional LysR family regulator
LENVDGEPLSAHRRFDKANNGMLLAEMAVAGSGIVYGPCFILAAIVRPAGAPVARLADQCLPIHVVTRRAAATCRAR